jgi:hypothetical protein
LIVGVILFWCLIFSRGFSPLGILHSVSRAKCCEGNGKVQFQPLTHGNCTASPMPHCKPRNHNAIPKWHFLPVGRIYPAKVAVFRAIVAVPFASCGECASCGNAQQLSCQQWRKVIPSGDIRPAFALPIPSRYTPRYCVANLPAMLPLANRSAQSYAILAHCSTIDYCCLYHVIV